jgi:hypothetical protein
MSRKSPIIEMRIYPNGLVSVARQVADKAFIFRPYYPGPASMARVRRVTEGEIRILKGKMQNGADLLAIANDRIRELEEELQLIDQALYHVELGFENGTTLSERVEHVVGKLGDARMALEMDARDSLSMALELWAIVGDGSDLEHPGQIIEAVQRFYEEAQERNREYSVFIDDIWDIVGDGAPWDYPGQVVRAAQELRGA